MSITFRSLNASMPQQFLDISHIYAIFQQMCGERVSQSVEGCGFIDPCILFGIFKDMLGGTFGKMITWRIAWEQPLLRTRATFACISRRVITSSPLRIGSDSNTSILIGRASLITFHSSLFTHHSSLVTFTASASVRR